MFFHIDYLFLSLHIENEATHQILLLSWLKFDLGALSRDVK